MKKRIKSRVSLEHSQGVVQNEKRLLNRIDYCWGKPRVRECSHIGLLAGCNGPRGAKTPTLASSERRNYLESQQNGPDRFTWAVGRVLLILEHESRALRWRRAELKFRTSAFLNRSASLWLRVGIWRGRRHLPFKPCFLGTASATIGWSVLCQVL